MGYSFDRTFVPPFPRLPVTVTLPENGMRSPTFSELVDTGADATLIPAQRLRELNAKLGRNVLNRLILLLDGPAGEADILLTRPRRRSTGSKSVS